MGSYDCFVDAAAPHSLDMEQEPDASELGKIKQTTLKLHRILVMPPLELLLW